MASDYLLELDGIKGESSDGKHIDISSYSFGASNPSSLRGGGSGKVVFQDFHFTKREDSTSPTLFIRCATGEPIKKATLTLRKSGDKGDAFEYLKITLEDCLVSSFAQAGDDLPPNDTPVDSFSLAFAKIKYSHFTEVPGGQATAVTVGWDLIQNKKV